MKKGKSQKRYRKLDRRSFVNKDFSGEDFSYADIRGVNFTNATLKAANFSHARAGQPIGWIVGLVTVLWMMIVLTSSIAAFSGLITATALFSQSTSSPVALGGSIFTLSIFLVWLFLWRGPDSRFIFVASVVVLVAVLTVIINRNTTVSVSSVFYIFFFSAQLVNAIAISIASGSLWLIANKSAIPILAIAISVGLSTTLSFYGVSTSEQLSIDLLWPFYGISLTVTVASILIGIYLAWKAIALDSRYAFIHKFIISLSSMGGTSFRQADLTHANFTQAILEKADFRQATLTRSKWFGAKRLAYAHLDETYLAHPKSRQLATTLKAQGEVFDALNLRYLNLAGADLQEASFIGADLSDADLSQSNLCGAKLVRTQLYQANLSGACLTGAYIQDWGISANTGLKNIDCDYVYMRLPTQQDPDPWRKPDNRSETFQADDFEDFMTPIIKTLDLYRQQHIDPRKMANTFKSLDFYHHDGIDPTASAIALRQLAEENPAAGLKVVALDGQGDQKIRLQARFAGNFDQSELNRQYFEKYQQAIALPYTEQQTLMEVMAEKDQRIQNIETMLKSAIKAGESYIKINEEKITQKILVFSANPQNTDQRRLAVEVREIKEGLQRAQKRDRFEIVSKWAVRPADLRRALLDYEPHIVHFSGYGSANEGLAFENELGQVHFIKTAALANLFNLFKDKIECVVLNSCYSNVQAEAISQHIHYVVGMSQDTSDNAAIHFAVGFYDALGAGRTIEDAFEMGHVAIELQGLASASKPVLKKK